MLDSVFLYLHLFVHGMILYAVITSFASGSRATLKRLLRIHAPMLMYVHGFARGCTLRVDQNPFPSKEMNTAPPVFQTIR